MIAELKPYPEYRDENISWAHRLPAHWDIKRGKALFAESLLPVREEDEIVTCFRDGQVTLRKNRRSTGFMLALYEAGYQGVRKGQLVIHAMDAFAGAIGVSDSDGKCTPEYIVTDPRSEGLIPQYFALLLRHIAHRGFILISCPAVRERAPRFRYPNFGDMPLMVPPPKEQAVIVRFLDHANGRLERAIRAKRKVIALLNEQKQAIIHRAVTRGLDPAAPLKPSGIPRLGDIPAHWEVSRLKNEFRCLNTRRIPLNSVERGAMTSRVYDYYGASGVIDKVENYIFDDELLLIAEDGANLVLRNLPLAIIARGRFWVNNHAHILKPKRGSIVYLAHVLETINYQPWISGSAQPKLTQDRLLAISLAVPSPEEQEAIVQHTEIATRPIRTAITRLEREIALLREYRTRLVADVVTGQLDVRPAAPHLPAEPSDMVPLASEDGEAEEESALPESTT